MSVAVIDRGRGPELSTVRVTIGDLFPYFERGCSDGEIRAVMPALAEEDLRAAREYVATHYAQVAAAFRRNRELDAKAIDEQRRRFPLPSGSAAERMAVLKRKLEMFAADARDPG